MNAGGNERTNPHEGTLAETDGPPTATTLRRRCEGRDWGCSAVPVVGEDRMTDEPGEPLGVALLAPAVIEEEPAGLR